MFISELRGWTLFGSVICIKLGKWFLPLSGLCAELSKAKLSENAHLKHRSVMIQGPFINKEVLNALKETEKMQAC